VSDVSEPSATAISARTIPIGMAAMFRDVMLLGQRGNIRPSFSGQSAYAPPLFGSPDTSFCRRPLGFARPPRDGFAFVAALLGEDAPRANNS
jgi:hypothetical protein